MESEDTIELYDSGSTHHLSPYHNHFVSFHTTPPRSFDAANQQSFSATRVGDMLVEVPNGADMSTIRLIEVLYAPEIGYTLISIGRIDNAGSTVTFGGGCCTITTVSGTVIGKIPKSPKGLYHVEHAAETGSANVAEQKCTILELHCCMGHMLRSLYFAPILFAMPRDRTPNLATITVITDHYTPYPMQHHWSRLSHSLMAVHLMFTSC